MLSTSPQPNPREEARIKVIKLVLSPDHSTVMPERIPDVYLGDSVRFVGNEPGYWVKVSVSGKTSADPTTPFNENPIVGSRAYKVEREGVFEFKCLISTDGGATWIGWENGSGGELPIPPH
ncbi:MAG TPA: hypothetical protein VLN58_13320 [Verrucomicrobiae bacterium]|nr:hypothetical protein [Verrucomicrobiae bacterium]